jgi:hypothetical protein
MRYELEQIAGTNATNRAPKLRYGTQHMTAAALVRLLRLARRTDHADAVGLNVQQNQP